MNRMFAYWLASETAEMASWLTALSMTTSAELTAALSRFCTTTGSARRSSSG